MAKKSEDKKNIACGAAAGSETVWYNDRNRGNKFRKIEACYSSLEAAKAFVVATPFSFEYTGNKEVDNYVENLVRLNDLKSMNFISFAKNVLEFIHYGVSITEVVWQEDSQGLPFPAYCVKVNPERLSYENGVFVDRNTGKPFDLTKYYIAVESISDQGFDTSLLDAIEPVCKIINEANKTLPPAIRKYKNQPKVGVVKSTGNITTDQANCETISGLLSGMDEKSTITVTDLEKIFPGIIADIEKVQTVEDKQEMKILRAYIGHSELLAGSGTGNNTKMIKIMEIADHYKRFRVSVLEKCINELLTNLVYGRWNMNYAVPYLRFDIDTEAEKAKKLAEAKQLPGNNDVEIA